MDKKTLDSIKNGVQDVCKVNEDNLENRTEHIAKWQYDVYMRWARETIELNKIKVEMKRVHGELYRKYKYEDNRAWDTKGEIESQIYTEKKYTDLCIKYHEQEYIVKTLEGCTETLKTASFQIRNTIDFLKYKSGIF